MAAGKQQLELSVADKNQYFKSGQMRMADAYNTVDVDSIVKPPAPKEQRGHESVQNLDKLITRMKALRDEPHSGGSGSTARA